jgi:phage baseplate assembly protein gpV
MAGKLFELGATQSVKELQQEKKIYGVVNATVVECVDCLGEARVQLMLPWLPGYLPWARIASPMAGMARGSFMIPQVGDEVLVAFNHGDVREPYVIGSLWNTIDRPPALSPTDAVTKRVIRTPFGQEISFDEALQSVTISNTIKNSLTLDAKGAQLSAALCSVTLDISGSVTITAIKDLTLQSNVINITGGTINISSTAATTINGGPKTTIAGGQIDIG